MTLNILKMQNFSVSSAKYNYKAKVKSESNTYSLNVSTPAVGKLTVFVGFVFFPKNLFALFKNQLCIFLSPNFKAIDK